MRLATDILAQLQGAGLTDYIAELDPSHAESAVHGRMRVDVVARLSTDARFASGVLYQLHRDVGANLTEFRAYPGEIGDGSLQIVIDKTTGRFYADIDRFNPYADVVNAGGHAFVEVLPNWLRAMGRFVTRRKKKAT
jgi:hypothetical protein